MTYQCASCGGPVTKTPLTKSGSGLGTWNCVRGCQKRPGTILRFLGSGKEEDSVGTKRREESVHILRKIKVTRSK